MPGWLLNKLDLTSKYVIVATKGHKLTWNRTTYKVLNVFSDIQKTLKMYKKFSRYSNACSFEFESIFGTLWVFQKFMGGDILLWMFKWVINYYVIMRHGNETRHRTVIQNVYRRRFKIIHWVKCFYEFEIVRRQNGSSRSQYLPGGLANRRNLPIFLEKDQYFEIKILTIHLVYTFKHSPRKIIYIES